MVSTRKARPAAGFELDSFLPYRLSLLSRLTQNLLAANLAGSGVTSAQWRVYLCLATRGCSSLSAISGFTRLPQSTLSRSIAQMAELGWVRSGRDSLDARVARIELTAKGRRHLSGLTSTIESACDAAFDLGAAEKSQLLDTLGVLIERLSTPEEPRHA